MTKVMFLYLFITLLIIILCIVSIKTHPIEDEKIKDELIEDKNIYTGTDIICAEHVDTNEKYEINISNGSMVYAKPINCKNITHHTFKEVTEFSSVRRLRPNGIYRHFKKKYYKYIKVVYDVSTGRYLALYMALYGDNKYWLRPIEDFLSKVDLDKYPESKQKYKFELIKKDDIYKHEICYHLISASNYFLKLKNNSEFDFNDFCNNLRKNQKTIIMKILQQKNMTEIKKEENDTL